MPFYGLLLLFTFSQCNTSLTKVQNVKKGTLNAKIKLKYTEQKKFVLDSVSAPKPDFMQFVYINGERYLAILNDYAGCIYMYNYSTTEICNKIFFDKEGPDGIPKPAGFYIKNLDSIYIFDMVGNVLALINSDRKVKARISLKGEKNDDRWFVHYPQYEPRTVNPLFEINNELIFTGQYPFPIPEDIINNFRFNAQIDLKTNEVKYYHLYPKELYGNNSNWRGGAYTLVFPELHPDGDKIIYSFPVSHDLYVTRLKSDEYTKIYAGSNFAGTICSMTGNPKENDRGKMFEHHCKQDFYTAIRYDKYRKVYYRFLWKGIKNASIHSKLDDKPFAVIIMDENFNYLGETEIGTGKDWNWWNSFVTSEGLNIEYIEKEFKEVYLTFKIFNLKDIDNENNKE